MYKSPTFSGDKRSSGSWIETQESSLSAQGESPNVRP